MRKDQKSASPARVVQYLRMSTSQQPNSLAHQSAAISTHAQGRGYEIVRTYEDAGLSGVAAKGRPAFQELLATVLGGRADFEAILVYDVSRWGRFQDPDEAAHYEFLCAQEGVRIEYCAEAFGGGLAVPDVLMKALKRAMAAEFSRELGAKVKNAQRRYAADGYWLHGDPGYGLARQVAQVNGTPGRRLSPGERNADRDTRTVLVKGVAREVEIVRRMFRLCVKDGMGAGAIASRLNQENVPSPKGRTWSAERVREILTNPKYAGVLTTQRRTTPLGGRRRVAPAETWISSEASPPLVSKSIFNAAQEALCPRPSPPHDEALLDALRAIAETYGVVSEPRLKALGVAYHRSYRHRFGSLQAAFARVGYAPPKHFPKGQLDDDALLTGLANLFLRCGDISPRLINADPLLPSASHYRVRFGSLAKAYALIGFVRISASEAASPLGAARLAARRRQIEMWAVGGVGHGAKGELTMT
ncbi:recombinase family protein [Phenylobacterium sp.]|uniref:recombinase family protein n=1 Tax=Phenylobacterium sp. TaxID=1871053 RepID=UPI002731389F|nr:recombinase family protein [Phenylobacterium sp.]MDP1601067.1 recombinase family protein [Phenylobacterium sp.]MDP3593785.1 recombinase family protein [Phenylobacterium sp.]